FGAVTRWGSRGCAARVITVASAGAGTRTCARNPTTPVGTWTADTPTTRRSPSRTPCRCRTTTATSNWRRCCARGSSASRRSSVRSYPRAGGSASTASAPALTLPAQVALAQGATVHVLTRSAKARALALELGAASAGGAYDAPPEPLDSAILFAPVGDLVLPALSALDRGGTLAIAGIHLTDIPPLNYEKHLFYERRLVSVTA